MAWLYDSKKYIIQNTGWSSGTSWFDYEYATFYSMSAAKKALKRLDKLEDCLYRIKIVRRQVSEKKIRETTTFTDVLYGTLWGEDDFEGE